MYSYVQCVYVAGFMCVSCLNCMSICEVCNYICTLLYTHVCDCLEVRSGIVCMSLDHGLCMVVFICGAVNVSELFKCVVVYFWGLGYMCSS